MTYTSRLRLALALIALLPPLVAVGAVYVYSSREFSRAFEARAAHQVSRFVEFRMTLEKSVQEKAAVALGTPALQQALFQLERSRTSRVDMGTLPAGLDFAELVDSSGQVLASAHRPGLVGNSIRPPSSAPLPAYTTEFDLHGRHAAVSVSVHSQAGLTLVAGQYLDHTVINNLRSLLEAEIVLQFTDSADPAIFRYEPHRLYEQDGRLRAVLLGSMEAGFVLTVEFIRPAAGPPMSSLLAVTAMVTLFSVMVALGIGWYLTGKAKREIENLVEASHRIAGGDFSTPVIAYEEGQFAQLADALTDMMANLRRVQRELATAEKIAAWQAMGRKIAHEVKNPLTPIAISVDDLRRSFEEQQPHFDRILLETTGTIKVEVARLTRLLDQFVAFARMSPPELREAPLAPLFDRIESLYRTQLAAGCVRLAGTASDLWAIFDIDRIEQVLVNLIKNGLEAAPSAAVSVAVEANDVVRFVVSDTGPGFPADVLEHQFEPRVSSKSDGFGLGLVICQRIIHDHGGEIRLDNHDDGGAVVSFTLRRADGQDTYHR